MKRHIVSVLRPIVLVVALGWVAASSALTVEGLSPFASIDQSAVNAAVTERGLELDLPDGQRITVRPWPKFMPQCLKQQVVRGQREMSPSGPSDRLSFTRPSDQQPWLLLGANSRRATRITGEWHLQLINDKWFITDGKVKKKFRRGRHAPFATMSVESGRWNVYLLDATTGKPLRDDARHVVSTETEPRISWLAVRQIPADK